MSSFSDQGRSDFSPRSDVASEMNFSDVDEDRFDDFSELGGAIFQVAPATGSGDVVPFLVAASSSSSSSADLFAKTVRIQILSLQLIASPCFVQMVQKLRII